MTSTELISKDKNSGKSKRINFHTAFWANFNMNLKSLKKILIVMCVLHILGLPLLMISTISYNVFDSYAMEGFIPLSVCCLAVALLMGFIIALNSFDYLYKKSKVDMIYSLPLTTKQRFLSDYFSGLCAYTIPYILSVIITLIIHSLACLGIKEWAENNQDEYITSTIIKLAFCGLFIMIMFYTLTVLVTSCCGSMFEAIAYNIIANGLIPGVIAVFFLVFFNDLYGIDVQDYLLRYISNSSPIGACIGTGYNWNSDIFQLLRWYLLTIIADGIYFFIAYFLYSKRKAEDVSKPFVFRVFYYITMTAITFIIISLMIEIDDADIIPQMMFLSAIIYFICEVIANRGFRKFGWSVLRYIGTVCSVIALCLILKGTNGFNIENMIPSASSIESVSINYDGIYTNDNYSDNDNDTITFNDKQTIQDVIDFHKDAVENHFNSYIPSYNDIEEYDVIEYYDVDVDDYYYNDYSDYYNSIKIIYNTKFGGKISRVYRVSFEQYMMLKDLSVNKSFIEKSANEFKDDALNRYYNPNDEYYYTYKTTIDLPIQYRKYYMSVSSKIQINSKEYNNLTYSQIIELAECYKQDLENRTLDDILTPDDTYCYLNGYVIFSSYENTIKFLIENDFIPPTLEVELQSYSLYIDDSYYSSCKLYSPSDIVCVGGDYYTSVNAYKSNSFTNLTVNSELLKLLEVAQPNYVTTDRCYMLSFEGNMYVIPKAYTDIAKEFYNASIGSKDYYIQTALNTLDYDYLDCYLNVHDIWEKNFSKNYTEYNYFVEMLLYGNVDIYTNSNDYTGNISANEFNTLQNYYDYYWTIYYNGNMQQYWNDWGIEDYPNYDDFVWYILKYNFNNADDDVLFNNDINTSNNHNKEDNIDKSSTNDTNTTTSKTEENPKIDDKPIDENLSNL